jgi:hypothetical protein
MPDYGPGYDPDQANYITPHDQMIGGLITAGALATVGIAVAGLYAGAAVVGNPVVYQGVIYTGLTAAQRQLIAMLAEVAVDGGPVQYGQGAAVISSLLVEAGIFTVTVLATYNAVSTQGERLAQEAMALALANPSPSGMQSVNGHPGNFWVF